MSQCPYIALSLVAIFLHHNTGMSVRRQKVLSTLIAVDVCQQSMHSDCRGPWFSRGKGGVQSWELSVLCSYSIDVVTVSSPHSGSQTINQLMIQGRTGTLRSVVNVVAYFEEAFMSIIVVEHIDVEQLLALLSFPLLLIPCVKCHS
jgi:hypothetical protein